MNVKFSYLVILLCFACKQKVTPETIVKGRGYYFSNAGNDTNEGTSYSPWKSITKLNTVQLNPGDSVCFKGGEIFDGTVLLDSNDAGSADKHIIITSYGGGEATVNGGSIEALSVSNTSFVDVSHLKFQGAGRKSGNTKNGVFFSYASNIHIDSIEVQGFQKAGVQIYVGHHIIIRNVYAHDNGYAGINISGASQKSDCTDVLITHCIADNNPGDPTNLTNHSGNGILAGYCRNVIMEYSTATNNGWDMPRKGNGPVGIWCFEADSIIIQHCISYRNKTAPGAADGGGFDLDGGVTNSIIQYCLSYENEGSAFGLFQYAGASNWYNNIVRYCISENDGSVSPAHAGVFVWNSSDDSTQLKDCYFYNNTIYNAKGAAISYEAQSLNMGFRFYNNIFVGRDSLILGKETNSIYLGNNWYSIQDGFNANGIKNFETWTSAKNKERYNGNVVGLNSNPLFVNPGHTAITSAEQLPGFNNYMVPANSVLRTGGLQLQQLFGIDNGGKSFNQQTAPANGIGACF
ncbi:MAG: right-handed parallel beta-helix repeat-containing protein [Agriterribacter sp.]